VPVSAATRSMSKLPPLASPGANTDSFNPADRGPDPQPDPEPPEPNDIQSWINDSGASVVLLCLLPLQGAETQDEGQATQHGRS